MELLNTRTMRYIVNFLVIIFSISSIIQAQNRLVVPFAGSWNFRITNVNVSTHETYINQKIQVNITLQCLESSDNTGYIRIKLKIKGDAAPEYIKSCDINLSQAGRFQDLTFEYIPPTPGNYAVTAEVWGGASYLWLFHAVQTSFRAQRQKANFDLTSLPAGLKMLQPYKNGDFTYFTFELDPGSVNAAANDYWIAENYVRHMMWIMANEKWNYIDQNLIIAIAAAIAVKSLELNDKAKNHRDQYLQVQYKFNDSVLPFIEVMRAAEMALSTITFIHQVNMIRHLPYMDLRIYY